jgi:hypothetical protein
MEIIKQKWNEKFDEVEKTVAFGRLLHGDLEVKHYAALMRQIFHHARENPQIQTLAASYLRGTDRAMVKPFFRHATSEIGHDQLALNDLKALGVDTSGIPWERPLPATTSLLAFAFYQIQHLDPIGYLGYLFHLEFMPTRCGKQILSSLERAGVPSEAMSFIYDHSTIDVGHNKLMENYVAELVCTEERLDTVIYTAHTTADLYVNMIASAFAWADKPYHTGISPYENRDKRLDPSKSETGMVIERSPERYV